MSHAVDVQVMPAFTCFILGPHFTVDSDSAQWTPHWLRVRSDPQPRHWTWEVRAGQSVVLSPARPQVKCLLGIGLEGIKSEAQVPGSNGCLQLFIVTVPNTERSPPSC